MRTPFPFLFTIIHLNVKLILEHRYELLGTFVITFFKLGLFLMTWFLFFSEYVDICGWTFREMLLLSGILNVGVGVVEIFCYGLRLLPLMIANGQLEIFLMQPRSTILICAFSRGKISNVADMLSGFIFIGFSGYFSRCPVAIVAVLLLGVVFSFSLMLYISCLAFFLRNGNELVQEIVAAVRIVASQPNSAFGVPLHFFTVLIVPIAFFSYFPVEALRQHSVGLLLLTALGTFLFLRLACGTFHYCLRCYESTATTHLH
jgi:ABC-2 type transport system permease protein